MKHLTHFYKTIDNKLIRFLWIVSCEYGDLLILNSNLINKVSFMYDSKQLIVSKYVLSSRNICKFPVG